MTGHLVAALAALAILAVTIYAVASVLVGLLAFFQLAFGGGA